MIVLNSKEDANPMKRMLCIVAVLALCLSLVTVNASAEGKVSLKFATNWGPGDAKYDYFEPLYNEYVDSVKDTARYPN